MFGAQVWPSQLLSKISRLCSPEDTGPERDHPGQNLKFTLNPKAYTLNPALGLWLRLVRSPLDGLRLMPRSCMTA